MFLPGVFDIILVAINAFIVTFITGKLYKWFFDSRDSGSLFRAMTIFFLFLLTLSIIVLRMESKNDFIPYVSVLTAVHVFVMFLTIRIV